MSMSLQLGEHYIGDLSGCNRELLMDSERCYTVFVAIISESGLSVLNKGLYKFSPHGFTCFLLLSESHASLHAWPERGYCAIDLFSCNLKLDLMSVFENLVMAFGAGSYTLRRLDRSTLIN